MGDKPVAIKQPRTIVAAQDDPVVRGRYSTRFTIVEGIKAASSSVEVVVRTGGLPMFSTTIESKYIRNAHNFALMVDLEAVGNLPAFKLYNITRTELDPRTVKHSIETMINDAAEAFPGMLNVQLNQTIRSSTKGKDYLEAMPEDVRLKLFESDLELEPQEHIVDSGPDEPPGDDIPADAEEVEPSAEGEDVAESEPSAGGEDAAESEPSAGGEDAAEEVEHDSGDDDGLDDGIKDKEFRKSNASEFANDKGPGALTNDELAADVECLATVKVAAVQFHNTEKRTIPFHHAALVHYLQVRGHAVPLDPSP